MEAESCGRGILARKRRYFIGNSSKGNNKFFVFDSLNGLAEITTEADEMKAEYRNIAAVSPDLIVVLGTGREQLSYIDVYTGEIRQRGSFLESKYGIPIAIYLSGDWLYARMNERRGMVRTRKLPSSEEKKDVILKVDKMSPLEIRVKDVITVGKYIFASGSRKGVNEAAVWNENLRHLDTYELNQPLGAIVPFGDSKVVSLGTNSFILDIKTGSILQSLTTKHSLVQTLIFPESEGSDHKVMLVVDTNVQNAPYKVIVYDAEMSRILARFNDPEHKRYYPFDDSRLMSLEDGKSIKLLSLTKLLTGKSTAPEIVCEIQNPQFTLPVISLPVSEGRKEETEAIKRSLMDLSPLDRDTAGVVANFI